MRRVIFILALILFPGTAMGASFSVPLPGLVGEIDFLRGQGKEVGFDFGQQFSDIQNVWIEIEAHVFALEFDECGTLFDPAPCVHKAQLLGLTAQLDDGLDVLAGFAFSDGLSFYDGSSTLEGVGTDVGSFHLFNPSLGWDFLLSGKGDFNLFWDSTFGNPDRIIIIVTEPSGEIFGARLIIEATPVPEPSAALLLTAALLTLGTLSGIKKRRHFHRLERILICSQSLGSGMESPMRRVIFILALMLFPGTAIGMSFSAPLTGLVGVVDFPTSSGKDVSFNFGQQFSEITSVSIEIEAHVFAQEFDVCGTAFDPQSCVHTVQLLGFVAQLDTEGSPVFSVQSSGGLSFGDFGALEGSGIDIAVFDDQFVQLGFDYLLDGQGSLTLFWNRTLGNPDRLIQNVIDPSGEIFSARLIIEGTPLPEPSTALLTAAALLTVAAIKERSIS